MAKKEETCRECKWFEGKKVLEKSTKEIGEDFWCNNFNGTYMDNLKPCKRFDRKE